MAPVHVPKARETRNKAMIERYFREVLDQKKLDVMAADQALEWMVVVQFRLKDGKIAGEWVMRDELGMLLQLGKVVVGP